MGSQWMSPGKITLVNGIVIPDSLGYGFSTFQVADIYFISLKSMGGDPITNYIHWEPILQVMKLKP